MDLKPHENPPLHVLNIASREADAAIRKDAEKNERPMRGERGMTKAEIDRRERMAAYRLTKKGGV